MKFSAKRLAIGGVTAALYVVLTLVTSLFGLSSGFIQFRLSEALCILPCFTPAAIPGLFIGCLLANLLSGAAIWDIILGSIATLLGAIGTYFLRKRRFLASMPPIVANTIIVPLVLVLVYHVEMAYILIVLSIGISEIISAGVLGQLLYIPLSRKHKLFG